MCPRRALALLKWCALCLIHTSYSALNPLEVKQPCRVCARDLHTFMIRCFSSLSEEEEVSAYFYGNLSDSHSSQEEKSHAVWERKTRSPKQTATSDWQRAGYGSRLWGERAYFFRSCRVERGNDERSVVYLWEVSIDTTPAQKMTGLGSSPVLQGEARLSAWRRCNSNAAPCLKALGHCHHSCSDLCQRCSAVFAGQQNCAAESCLQN